ncbi:MAG TPA: SGNH/GDSL hydrolase family protein [Acidobacteriota bacterium]|nr:SGNH/GDSL hydrolase family protein [Acidobacteriota bacterium]
MLEILRQAHPKTPIILVKNLHYPNGLLMAHWRARYLQSNAWLRKFFEERRRNGDAHIYYISADGLIRKDGEATVDGIHPTDLGFLRMANRITPVLQSLISKTGGNQAASN